MHDCLDVDLTTMPRSLVDVFVIHHKIQLQNSKRKSYVASLSTFENYALAFLVHNSFLKISRLNSYNPAEVYLHSGEESMRDI